MQFKPMTDEEIELGNLLPPGIYPFEVFDAEECVSKKGNDMIKLKLSISDPKGQRRIMYDYLLASMPKKLKHFAKAMGLLDKYDSGTINSADCYQRHGSVQIGIEQGAMGDNGVQYPPKNVVLDYVGEMAVMASASPAKPAPGVETSHPAFADDIPF